VNAFVVVDGVAGCFGAVVVVDVSNWLHPFGVVNSSVYHRRFLKHYLKFKKRTISNQIFYFHNAF
jgi:hypothetical protein